MKTWLTKNGGQIIRILSGRSNVFLLIMGTKNILVDTSSKSHWKLLDKQLKNLGIRQLDYLILTHTHYDHASNAFQIKEKYKAKVIVHKDEADYLAAGKNIMIKGTNLYTRTLASILKNINPHLTYTPCPYDVIVDSMLEVSVTGFNVTIMHTPGHTPGSMSVIIDDEIALVGDAMFGIFRGSVFPPFALDIKQMIKSWGKLLGTNCRLFMPSHGSPNPRVLMEKEYEKWSGILK